MSSKRNKKLCWNCEGEIDKDALYCLFCGTELMDKAAEKAKDLPEPPYRAKKSVVEAQEEPVKTDVKVIEEPVKKEVTLSFLLLLVGSVFFTFSFLLLLFSKNDLLTLSWDASYWYIYLLFSTPFLFFGWRALN